MELRQLILPRAGGQTETLETPQSVLLLGANGAGKTRLGTWIEIESPQKRIVHRISAQKSLSMPDSTTPESIDLAEKNLLFGNHDWGYEHKLNKWGRKPATSLLSDFEKLMVYLFSEETEQNANYKALSKASHQRIDPPTTKLDRLKKVWEEILPHRELVVGGLRIQTRVKYSQDSIYNSSEMSDGERVIFYLIGQCLAAPVNGIVVIDEPELHLHKSIQSPLWDAIERLRQDCTFVYLTHDVDFAADRKIAQKIWLKSFDGSSWEWETIEEDKNLPDDLLLEVLGCRKPVVFVEGEKGSLDSNLYRELLPDCLVVPIGSCNRVILSVKALKANAQLHHLEVFGLIDRDRRPEAEIAKLEQDSIYVLEVAEVENLFCTQEVIKVVSDRMGRNAEEDFNAVSRSIFGQLTAEINYQISLRVSAEVKFQLSLFDTSQCGATDIDHAMKSLVTSIDVHQMYVDTSELFRDLLSNRNYRGLLALYNRKSLASRASAALGLASGSLPETIIRLMRTDCRTDIVDALRSYFGKFQNKLT